jgi:hypothetical protein
MMLAIDMLRELTIASPKDAWTKVFDYAWSICAEPLPEKNIASEILRRDDAIAPVDLFLSSAAWNLWFDYYNSVTHTAEQLLQWWDSQLGGRAILILDGLSIREAPWIIEGAKTRGYAVSAGVTCSELPGDTNSFAKALTVSQRSSLENNKIPSTTRLKHATSDTSASNWADCLPLIGAQPNWIFWHHWPDNRIHELGTQSGKGLVDLTKEIMQQLTDDFFWQFVERLTTGRNLVITSDHGYAASGRFPDVSDPYQATYLKSSFGSQRHTNTNDTDIEIWMPPLDLTIGQHRLALGRRHWKSQGGYPNLAHGGLTVLECASPFIELTR